MCCCFFSSKFSPWASSPPLAPDLGGRKRTWREDGHPRRGSRGYRDLLPPDPVCGDLGRLEEQELRCWRRWRPEREHHGRGKGHRIVRWWIHDDRWVFLMFRTRVCMLSVSCVSFGQKKDNKFNQLRLLRTDRTAINISYYHNFQHCISAHLRMQQLMTNWQWKVLYMCWKRPPKREVPCHFWRICDHSCVFQTPKWI